MRRVLVVIASGFTPYGGIATVIMNYYRAMDKKELQIDFATSVERSEELVEELKRNGSECYNLGDRWNQSINYITNFIKLLKQKEYDVLHMNGNSATMLPELLAAKKLGVPVRIAHNHNLKTFHPILNCLLRSIFKRSYTIAVSVSKAAGDWLYGEGNYTVINNAIDLSVYKFKGETRKEYREKLGVDGKFVIGNVGKLNEQKNQDFLIDIFLKVKEHYDNAVLLLVGGGAKENILRKKCEHFGIEKSVIFTGMVNNAYDFLQAMDVFVFPSKFEGLGLALIEAQASGLFCYASDAVPRETRVSELIEYIDLKNDPEVWAEKILYKKYESDRLKISDSACKKIKEHGYDITSEANKLLHLYMEQPHF